MEPTKRFTSKAKYYHENRPRYPKIIIQLLRKQCGIVPQKTLIADIGSGTGILSELFLQKGFYVYGIEPNDAMRNIAEFNLRNYNKFESIKGKAENTGLKDHSVNLVTAGQSFHWFNKKKARKEFQRILKDNGYVVLLWNNRNIKTVIFQDYEKILEEFGIDYHQVKANIVTYEEIENFFAKKTHIVRHISNKQRLDLEGLRGRLLSTSFIPTEEDQSYPQLMRQINRLFNTYQKDGMILFEYETEIHIGRLSG